MAVLGQADETTGDFVVEDHVFAGLPQQPPRTPPPEDEYVLLLSGLALGGDKQVPCLRVCCARLIGQGIAAERAAPGGLRHGPGGVSSRPRPRSPHCAHHHCRQLGASQRAVEVPLSANRSPRRRWRTRWDAASTRPSSPARRPCSSSRFRLPLRCALCSLTMQDVDDVLVQLAASSPVDLMPGPNDPSNHILPQQPLHAYLFPQGSGLATLRGVPNPYECSVHGVRSTDRTRAQHANCVADSLAQRARASTTSSDTRAPRTGLRRYALVPCLTAAQAANPGRRARVAPPVPNVARHARLRALALRVRPSCSQGAIPSSMWTPLCWRQRRTSCLRGTSPSSARACCKVCMRRHRPPPTRHRRVWRHSAHRLRAGILDHGHRRPAQPADARLHAAGRQSLALSRFARISAALRRHAGGRRHGLRLRVRRGKWR